MSRTEEFEQARPLLFAIAYRILGSLDGARDAVHTARQRYEAAPAVPAEPRAFLSDLVTRIAADMPRTAPVRDGEHTGPPPPAPPPADPFQDLGEPAGPLSASAAAALLLERLPPPARAFFVLREVFGRTLAQTASVVGCSPAVCRRLAAAVAEAGDTVGGARPWPGLIAGSAPVARVLAAVVPALLAVGVTMEPRPHGSRPGAVFRGTDGTVLGALTLDILDGRIQTVRWGAPPAPPAVPARPPLPDSAP
ncbi:RNA polymerase subunit sigma-24 [Streptomyces sp. NBC_01478]|uniref:sigma factor-like helix-turn-helix DNA-binding protein n=1 Tax=Streptomyces sp. NBC_01478 TaxID=2903882 RepID=UPI002E364192|nr:sigma factor-like helix-turn-helix DNA-binding protein [Streptomyces sp. NBC_01478]